jgi:DNA end-binding protein Ku
MGTKDTLIALIPRDEGLLVQTMFFEEEIKELPKSYSKQPVNEAELNMAKSLISSMDKPFDSSMYHDEYQARLRELISQKIAGKEIVSPASEPRGNVINLMEALQKSIEQNKTTPIKKPASRKKAVV